MLAFETGDLEARFSVVVPFRTELVFASFQVNTIISVCRSVRGVIVLQSSSDCESRRPSSVTEAHFSPTGEASRVISPTQATLAREISANAFGT